MLEVAFTHILSHQHVPRCMALSYAATDTNVAHLRDTLCTGADRGWIHGAQHQAGRWLLPDLARRPLSFATEGEIGLFGTDTDPVAILQGQVEGGFMGRTDKLVDGCYSFWQGGIFPLLQRVWPDYLAQTQIPGKSPFLKSGRALLILGCLQT